MIADGIAIDNFTLLKLKVQLVKVLNFDDISVVPSANGHAFHIQFGDVRELLELAYPCVEDLCLVLDAYHIVELAPSSVGTSEVSEDRPSSGLVGSVFVDVSIALFCTVRDLASLPVLTVKSMLEALCIMIYKHDFEGPNFKSLQQNLRRAVMRALELMMQDISYELRQLALSVAQAFVKRRHSFMGSIV